MSDAARCRATGKGGAPCKNHPERGSEFCRWHRALSNRDDSVTEILSTFTPAESQQGVPISLRLQTSPTGWEASLLAPDGRVACGPEEVPREIPWAFEFWAKVLTLCPQRDLLLAAPHFPLPLTLGDSELAAVWDETGGWVFRSGPGAFDLVPQAVGLACRFNCLGLCPLLARHDSIPLRADGLPDLRVLTTPREQWGLWDSVTVDAPAEPAKRGPGRPKQKRLAPLDHNGIIRAGSSPIASAIVRALSPGGLRRDIPDELARKLGMGEKWWAGIPVHSESKRAGGLDGLIGLPSEPDAALWDFLQRNGPLAVKAQFALWAQVYAETDAAPGRFVTQSISDFCDALGYERQKRAHKRENREQAVKVLQLLMQIELLGFFHGVGGKIGREHGKIWARGGIAEELDTYADLFGAVREGSQSEWVQVGFSYAPGHWFQNEEWRAQNRPFALVGKGLLGLRPDRDSAAILVGGYLATQARIARYAPKRLKLATIAERSGLLSKDLRNPGRAFDAVEKALDRLVETSVVGDWRRTDASSDEPDMDNPEDLACLVNLAENRRRAVLEITWPAAVLERAKGAKARG